MLLLKWVLSSVFITTIVWNSIGQNHDVEQIRIPEGSYEPLYNDSSRQKIFVESFEIDLTPITNAQFLKFVKENEHWRKSKAKRIFADASYLAHWESDTILGDKIDPYAPVVYVSWFAAKAYSRWSGRSLPTVDQWEYAASGELNQADGDEETYRNNILRFYEEKKDTYTFAVGQGSPNYYGVHDMHGLIWEWTIDFNSILFSGESRKDGSLDRDLFCAAGSVGSVDPANYAAFLRYSFRASLKASYCLKRLGFRTIKE